MDLTALIDTYRGPLVGLVRSWGVPWADAAEIAQDSLAEAWLRRERCRGDWQDAEVFGRWLRGVAHNQFRNWKRSHRRRQARVASVPTDTLENSPAIPANDTGERLEALREAIARLPAKQRQVVLMHYLEETSVKQVAALLSVTPKTVEGRLYQARRTLHRWLQEPSTSSFRTLLLCL